MLFLLLFLSPHLCIIMPWFHCVFTKLKNWNVFQQRPNHENSLMISHMLHSRLFLYSYLEKSWSLQTGLSTSQTCHLKVFGGKRVRFFFPPFHCLTVFLISNDGAEAPLLMSSFKTRHIPCQYLCYSGIFPSWLHLHWKSTGPPGQL